MTKAAKAWLEFAHRDLEAAKLLSIILSFKRDKRDIRSLV